MGSTVDTATSVPARSHDQRMLALRKANDVRTARARLKRDLKGGRTRIDELLAAPPEFVASMKVYDILVAVPKFGRIKANKVLNQCRISPSKTIAGLSERQRAELVQLLRR